MKKAAAFLLSFIAGVSVNAASAPQTADKNATAAKKPLKVLMIGNSFSVCVLKQMPQIARNSGCALDLASAHIGGCSLERHVNELAKAEADPSAKAHYYFGWKYVSDDGHLKRLLPKSRWISLPAALKADVWDVVTIQQASHFSIDRATYSPYGENLIKTIKELCPTAEVVIQETWSYTPYDNRLIKWGIDQNEMYRRLHDAYCSFAKDNSIRVIPTGEAVQLWRKKLPVKYTPNSFGGDVAGAMRFYKKDGLYKVYVDRFHFNEKGEYLQSLVWTAKLFGVDVTKCQFIRDKTIGTDYCRLMQEIANEVCR
mgnify:CR=1 FL=1